MERLESASRSLGMHMWNSILSLIIKSLKTLMEDMKGLQEQIDSKDKSLSLVPVAASTPQNIIKDENVDSADIPEVVFGGESGNVGDDEDSEHFSKANKPGARMHSKAK